jgi:hypothetical protein
MTEDNVVTFEVYSKKARVRRKLELLAQLLDDLPVTDSEVDGIIAKDNEAFVDEWLATVQANMMSKADDAR